MHICPKIKPLSFLHNGQYDWNKNIYMAIFNASDYSFDAIIFDCDGTLVDSAPLHYSAFQVALERQGAVLSHEWYKERLGLSRQELITEFGIVNSTSLDIPRAIAESEAQFLIRTAELSEIPEVVDIARSYFRKVPMAVASSGQRLSVKQSLESINISHLFDYILTADDVSACKPNPEIYITAAAKLQIETSKCLVFEDTNEGLASAVTAGAQTIDVRALASIYSKKR